MPSLIQCAIQQWLLIAGISPPPAPGGTSTFIGEALTFFGEPVTFNGA